MYPYWSLAVCSLDRLLHSPNIRRLHFWGRLSPEGGDGGDGGTIYQPVVVDSSSRLRTSLGGHKRIDLCMMTDFR